MQHESEAFLIVQAGALRCALPLAHVREVMRPLPVKTAAGLASGVLGASVIRGVPLPVLSLAHLLHQPQVEPARFVVLRTPGRDCVLAVDAVHSIDHLPADTWQQLPSLLRRVESAEQIGAEDQDLIVSLSMARIVSELPLPEALSA